MSNALPHSIKKLLRPLIRLLLKHGIAYGTLSDWVKRVYIETASEEFALAGRKQSVSRISVLTGINRKEVKKLLEEPEPENQRQTQHNRAARVIHGWLNDEDFLLQNGEPKSLELNSSETGFNTLVKRYSGDMTARAILDELLRVGVAKQNDKGSISLIEKAYIPHQSNDDMVYLAGDSVCDLLETVDHNLTSPADKSRLQLSVVYDNLPHEAVKAFRGLSRERATALLVEMDKFLSNEDRDGNPRVKGEGRYRAGLGIYYFEQGKGISDED